MRKNYRSANEDFDIVFSVFCIPPLYRYEYRFFRMVGVLRPGGKFVLIDMEAADEGLRNTEDKIETMRDPSHVKNMSMNELLNLFAMHNLSVEKCEKTEMKQRLKSWLSLTKTPEHIQTEITERMRNDMRGERENRFFSIYGRQ